MMTSLLWNLKFIIFFSKFCLSLHEPKAVTFHFIFDTEIEAKFQLSLHV